MARKSLVFYLPDNHSKHQEELRLTLTLSAQVVVGFPPRGLFIFLRPWTIRSFPQLHVYTFCGLPLTHRNSSEQIRPHSNGRPVW